MQEQIPLDLEMPPGMRSLRQLAQAEHACRRCPLYRDATQAVPGEGRRNARLILLGEQPGDKEDLAGKPFVGPAGRVLDEALADAGIPRDEVDGTTAFVTIHPSFLLRIEDHADKEGEYRSFVADLKLAAVVLRSQAA